MFFYHLMGAALSVFFIFLRDPGFENYWGLAFCSLILNGVMLLLTWPGKKA